MLSNEVQGSIAEGAALVVASGASATLQRDSACTSGSARFCSYLMGNRASATGTGTDWHVSVVAARIGGSIDIRGTVFEENQSLGAGGSRTGAILRSSASEPIPSTISLSNSVLLGNRARWLFSAQEWTPTGSPALRGEVVASLLTTRANLVDAIVGNEGGRSPFSLAAAVIDETVPFFFGAPSADATFDCIVSKLPLGVAATRSLVSNPGLWPDGAPSWSSPVVDYCSPENLPLGEPDVRGVSRPLGHPDVFDLYGKVDVGAYEVEPTFPMVGPSG